MSLKPKLYTSKQYMHRRYVVQKWSMEEIAKENDVTMMTIFNWLVKFGFVRDTKAKR